MSPADLHAPLNWVRELRRHHEGTLLCADRSLPVRFIIDGASGCIVLPIEGWILDHPEAVLFLPEERRDALQVLLELDAQPPAGAAQDRWAAYHSDTRRRLWASARISSLRRDDEVCEHSDLQVANPLRSSESALLRLLNANKTTLATACQRLSGALLPEPCAVGIDPHGIDVRARFGIVRAEFPAASCNEAGCIDCPDRAAAVIRELLDPSQQGESR